MADQIKVQAWSPAHCGNDYPDDDGCYYSVDDVDPLLSELKNLRILKAAVEELRHALRGVMREGSIETGDAPQEIRVEYLRCLSHLMLVADASK